MSYVRYLSSLTQRQRSTRSNRHLAYILSVAAGAINAGGFLAVERYTSHVTGTVSNIADQIALFNFELAWSGCAILFSFLLGGACSALMIQWGLGTRKKSVYTWPLLLEAVLLLCFGFLDDTLDDYEWLLVPLTVLLLSFVMGLQNALITDVSNAQIRTTHMTGMVTDIGMELGRFLQQRIRKQHPPSGTGCQPEKLRLLLLLVTLFFCGGVIGALGFKGIGCIFTVVIAAVLIKLAFVPVMDDFMAGRDGTVS